MIIRRRKELVSQFDAISNNCIESGVPIEKASIRLQECCNSEEEFVLLAGYIAGAQWMLSQIKKG